MTLSLSQNPHPPGPLDNSLIKDVGLATFMADVIEASNDAIIVVDFWAPWCGPCKQLTPALEKSVLSYKGGVRLVKIDIDQNQEIAQQMVIQSVPAVFAFYKGRPVDGFQGALPESQIRSWIDRLVKTTGVPKTADDGLETALKQAADFLTAKDIAKAQSIYADILDMEPTNVVAYAGFLRCLLEVGDVVGAKDMLAKASPDMVKHKAFDPARAALELAEQSSQTGPLEELLTKLQRDPADLQVRYDLALAFYAVGKREQAVDELLEIVRRNRGWNEDAARKQLVKFFDAFGAMDPVTIASRRRLSSILFS